MKSAQALTGALVVLSEDDPVLPEELFGANPLKYGIIVTYLRQAPYGWASPVAFVWFYWDRRSERQATLAEK